MNNTLWQPDPAWEVLWDTIHDRLTYLKAHHMLLCVRHYKIYKQNIHEKTSCRKICIQAPQINIYIQILAVMHILQAEKSCSELLRQLEVCHYVYSTAILFYAIYCSMQQSHIGKSKPLPVLDGHDQTLYFPSVTSFLVI